MPDNNLTTIFTLLKVQWLILKNLKESFLLRMKKLLNKLLKMDRVSLTVILMPKKRNMMTKEKKSNKFVTPSSSLEWIKKVMMLKNKKNLVTKGSDFVWNIFLHNFYLFTSSLKLINNKNLFIKETDESRLITLSLSGKILIQKCNSCRLFR